MVFLLVVFCILASVAATPLPQRHMLLTVVASTQEQFDILSHAAETDVELDFWTHPKLNGYTDVMIPASRFQEIRQKWVQVGLTLEVKQQDVEDFVDKVNTNSKHKKKSLEKCDTTLFHDNYRSYEEFIEGIKKLHSIHGSDLIRFDATGRDPVRNVTVEGRIIHFVEIGAKCRHGKKKPLIMLEVNIHAREWITGAATFYMMDWLLTNFGKDDGATTLLTDYDFVIIPIANPDGYEYSRLNDFTRFWRKNRAKHNDCWGVDLNRNFDAFWKPSGSCNSAYPGPWEKSEPETRAVIDIFHHYEENMVMFFAVHSYGQMLLVPWAHADDPEPVDEMHKVLGERMANAMTTAGNLTHRSGTVSKLIGYTAAGSTMDWALKTKQSDHGPARRNDKFLAFAYELRPSGGGFAGFVLESSHIIPTGKELIASLITATSEYCDVVKC